MVADFRVDQILPSFGLYDAIGTESRLIRDLIRKKGIESDIFTEEGVRPGESRPVREFHELEVGSDSFVIHQFSIGSLVPYYLINYPGDVITRYHNITPGRFFKYDSNRHARNRCVQGRSQFRLVSQRSRHLWAASRYNLEELSPGYFRSGKVLPVLRRYQHLSEEKGCPKVSELLQKDKRKTILFVGRVIPSKSHHHLMFFLRQLYDLASRDVRVIFVGSVDSYYGQKLLTKLAYDLQLRVSHSVLSAQNSDILFAGSVRDDELASYYRHADAFVCMSEHEGFCVPLVEAMHFGIPILAHPAAAVPDTLGSAGLKVDKHQASEFLQALIRVLWDHDLNQQLREKSLSRARDFSWDHLVAQFYACLDDMIQLRRQAGSKEAKIFSDPCGFSFSSSGASPGALSGLAPH